MAEGKIHFDKGAISPGDERFVNRAILSGLCPNFIPHLIVPDRTILVRSQKEQTHPVRRIGTYTWENLIQNKDIPFQTHLSIALTSLRQYDRLFTEYGLILVDRMDRNITVAKSKKPTDIFFGKNYWSVWQIDTESVYDAVTDTYTLNPEENFSARKGHVTLKDPLTVKRNVSLVFENIWQNLGLAVKKSSNQEDHAMYDRISHFFPSWKNDKRIDFTPYIRLLQSAQRKK